MALLRFLSRRVGVIGGDLGEPVENASAMSGADLGCKGPPIHDLQGHGGADCRTLEKAPEDIFCHDTA